MGANTFSATNVFTYILLAGLGVCSWLISLPRRSMEVALHFLDTFEAIMLSLVWEYQGENILQFLFKHQYVQTGALVINRTQTSSAVQAASIKTRGTQTETGTDAGSHVASAQERSTRDVLMDKMLEDLVPALLHALHEIPKRNELAELAHEQTQLVKSIYERQQQLMVDHNQPDNVSSDIVAPTLQLLISQVNAVDTRLLQMLRVLESNDAKEIGTGVDNRLALLVDSLEAVKAKCETDRMLAAEVMQSLTNLDKVISSAAVQKHYVDAAVSTETFILPINESSSNASSSLAAPATDHDVQIEQGTDISSELSADDSSCRSDNSVRSIKSSPSIGPGADSTCDDQVPLIAIELAVSTSSEEQDPIPFAKEQLPSDTTLRRVHYYEPAIKNTSSHEDAQAVKTRPSSRRFSLKNGIKRHSWFGKKTSK